MISIQYVMVVMMMMIKLLLYAKEKECKENTGLIFQEFTIASSCKGQHVTTLLFYILKSFQV